MIDLSQDSLPRFLVVAGRLYPVHTDYKTWLKFGMKLSEPDVELWELAFIFDGERPSSDFLEAAIEFYQSENSTPNFPERNGTKVLDYFEDGEYIYASILAVYGIDILDTPLHYHKFKALLAGLPDDCKLSQIISYRSYEQSHKKPEEVQAALKKAWALPVGKSEKEEFLAQMEDMFYNT